MIPDIASAGLVSGVIESGTWCLDSPLIRAAFGPRMAADLRRSAERRLRKSAVNSFRSSHSNYTLWYHLDVLLSLKLLLCEHCFVAAWIEPDDCRKLGARRIGLAEIH